jgi:ATP-dependent DNA helicase RecQ
MKKSQREETLGAFISGEIPILLMSPEMAFGGAFQALCDAANRSSRGFEGAHLTAIAVDEAHIIASWGRYFRPDFQRLPGLVRELRKRQPSLRTILLSATVAADLRKRLLNDFKGSGPTGEVVVAEPRDEFDIVWSHLPGTIDRDSLVIKAADIVPRPAIIYTTTVEDAERLHAMLYNRGYRRLELFTGEITDPIDRQRVIDSWALGDVDVVVATSAFGMGVDKTNVRAIVHACLPESADRLYQEIGRGGRDGHQALSLCLWNDGDAATAASLAIHGWMRPETGIRRWKAILREANQKSYFRNGPSGTIFLNVPLDARHEGLERITGQLNRQWNAALLTLLQRSGALRIIAEEKAENGAELWVAEIQQPAIVSDHPDLDQILTPYLSIGESEATVARMKAAELEHVMHNVEEGCFRTLLYDIVEPLSSPWPCGRCAVCRAVGKAPHTRADRHEFSVTWPDQAWVRPCAVSGGSRVVNPEEPTLRVSLYHLVTRLAQIGIEQFVTTANTVDALEQAVCESSAIIGCTLVLGGDVPPVRVPTAVIIANKAEDPEVVRNHCLELRRQFETDWKEVPILFVLSPDLNGQGTALSQHLSSQGPMAEQELTMIGSFI